MSIPHPLAALLLTFMDAIKPLFPRIQFDYSIHYIPRNRALDRLDRIHRLAIDIFVKLKNGAFRPTRGPRPNNATPNATPTPTATPTPRDPNRPRRARRIPPIRILAARLANELDKLAKDIGRNVPDDITAIVDHLLQALDLTRQAIVQRYLAIRTRLQTRRTKTSATTPSPDTIVAKTLEL